MDAFRLLPTLLLLGATALAAVTLAPSASAVCVDRFDDPSQDLVCAGPVADPAGTCVTYFLNPPLPGTSSGGRLCQPLPICNVDPCVHVPRMCFEFPRHFCIAVAVDGDGDGPVGP